MSGGGNKRQSRSTAFGGFTDDLKTLRCPAAFRKEGKRGVEISCQQNRSFRVVLFEGGQEGVGFLFALYPQRIGGNGGVRA